MKDGHVEIRTDAFPPLKNGCKHTGNAFQFLHMLSA